jgi:hypothetical protein
MENRFTRLRLISPVALALALMGGPSALSVVSGQQKKPGSKSDSYPTFFKVYSKDGRESLTATCRPNDLGSVVNLLTCTVVNVRVIPPDERPDKDTIPLSVGEALKGDPSLAQEVRKNPKNVEQELRKGLERVKEEFCSPSSKERVAIETNIRDPDMGPKRKDYYEQLIAACADKDPRLFFKRLLDLEQRTCGLWVDQFTLEFKKVREGQWLYRQETPGLFSKVLKVYELTGDGLLWTLSETRVPTKGSEEKPTQTVWSWKNVTEYELPCEFISHSLIQAR